VSDAEVDPLVEARGHQFVPLGVGHVGLDRGHPGSLGGTDVIKNLQKFKRLKVQNLYFKLLSHMFVQTNYDQS
jgi:hypothetical protein